MITMSRFSMERELVRAAAVVRAMTTRNSSNRQRVPVELLRRCKGVAVLQFAKVGMGFGGRVGTGVVVAKRKPKRRRSSSSSSRGCGEEYNRSLDHQNNSGSSSCGGSAGGGGGDKAKHENDDVNKDDDDDDENGCGWTAPSAILLMGLGGGLQIGAEVGALLLVLWTDAAVAAFSGSQLTLGADVGVALGPVGRAASVSLSSGRLDQPAASSPAPKLIEAAPAPSISEGAVTTDAILEAEESKSGRSRSGSDVEDESCHGSEDATRIHCGPSSSVIMGSSNHGERKEGSDDGNSIDRSMSMSDEDDKGDLRRVSSEPKGEEAEREQHAPATTAEKAGHAERHLPEKAAESGSEKEQGRKPDSVGSGAAILAYAHQQV